MQTFRKIVGLENTAFAAQSEHKYEEAAQAHSSALELAETLDRPRLTAVLCNRLGEVLEASSQVQRAVVAYESGLRALQNEPHSGLDRVIDSLRGAVKGFDQGHEFLEMLDLYSETSAEDLEEAEKDNLLAVKLLINTGNAYLRQPQNGPALNAYKEALGRKEIQNAPDLRAHALTHIAIIHRRAGEIDLAAAKLQEALDILGQHPDPLEKRRALGILASIQRERGELELAKATYQKALDSYHKANDALGEARTLAGLGHIYLVQKSISSAKPAFQQALAIAQQVKDEDTIWHASWGLGRCQYETGDLAGAAQSFQLSLRKIKSRQRELRTDEGKVTFLESVQDIYDHLIKVHLDLAHTQPDSYADALAVAEEARGQALFDLMGVRRRRFQSRQAGIRSIRTLTFSERMDSFRQEAPGVASDDQVFNITAQMAPAVQSAPAINLSELLDTPIWSEDTIGISDMVETAQAIPSTIPRWPEDEFEPEKEAEIEPAPLARLVFHVLSDRTGIMVITAGGSIHGYVSPLGEAEIAEQIANLRQSLRVEVDPRDFDVEEDFESTDEIEGGYLTLLRSLYTMLIEPIADWLPQDDTPVVIEPHKSLWLLPFAALRTPEGTDMVDHWSLLYSPSGQVIDEIRREQDYGGPENLKPLIVGNPVMPKVTNRRGVKVQLKPLPGAEQECQIIHQLFMNNDKGSTLLTADLADWAGVLAQIPNHGILHFATHGLAYSDNPLDSLIALGVPTETALNELKTHPVFNTWPQHNFLSDFSSTARTGLLTARQIVYLPIPADLVTLSACQTGLGQVTGDGMIGLSRSFLIAGARSVLVSQWSVSDRATAALMSAFYQGYIKFDNKAKALQSAMQTVRAIPEFTHPRYWAPFVVVGAEA